MDKPKLYITLLHHGLTRDLVFCHKDFKVDAFVFLNMNIDEAKYDISEMACQDRAEWVSTVQIRTYPGWKKSDVIEMEELIKNPNFDNVYLEY